MSDKAADMRITRRTHVTDPDAAFAEMQGENDMLVEQIASLESRLPSAEELAYLRNRKLADERATWAWRWLRSNVPIITAVCGGFAGAIYWLATHLAWSPPK